MMKKLLIFVTVWSLSLGMSAMTNTGQMYIAGVMEISELNVAVSYSDGALFVSGGEGLVLEVVSLTGKKVMEEQIISPAQKIELNIPKGCYIVKIGTVVRKISVR